MKKFKLVDLSDYEISKKSQNLLKGGAGNCKCGCRYADSGGSSTCENSGANYDGSLTSGPNDPTCGISASRQEQQFFSCTW